MEYTNKLNQLREGIVNDYLAYQGIKKLFDAPQLAYLQYLKLKELIMDFLKKKGLN